MKLFSKYSFFILAAAAMFGAAGCKKSFLDINSNPNAVTENNVTPELIFNNAAVRTGGRAASGNFTFLNEWMGYFANSADFAIQQEPTSYNITFTFGQALWQNHYDVLFDLEQVKRRSFAKGDSVLGAASMILSAKLWQELVDLYGNIPFTDAFHIERTSQPTYDKDSAVYRLLQGQLDQAIGIMQGSGTTLYGSSAGTNVVKFGAAGGSFNSQKPSWVRFANTLKLRLLIHSSEVTTPGVDRNAELAKIMANGGVLQSGESVNVNPGYSNEVGKQSPFYANYGFTPTGADANTSTRANRYSVDTLRIRSDPRLTRFYRGVNPSSPTDPGGSVVGNRYGAVTGNFGGTASSKLGFGTVNTPTQDQWILTSVESLFLLAEAVQRGWIPGVAKTAYQTAVQESFRWLGVPNADAAATTFTSSTTLGRYANFDSANAQIFDANPTPGGPPVLRFTFTPVKFIAYQKYIALNSISAQEAYADLRRLDMIPDKNYLSVNPSRHAGNKLPNRLLYPQEEYTLNFGNVSAQGSITQDNIFTTSKIFWQP